MSPSPSRNTPAGKAYNDLRNLAREDGRDSAEYFSLYALEGFLRRLAVSEQAEDFILKGGVLMAAYAARRPTRDVDLAAIGISNDIPEVKHRVRTIIERDLNDGLVFEAADVRADSIRDDADYSGVRVQITARLATARISMHIDVNFGDPIWPAPTEATVPLLLGGTVILRGYPDHMVLAEKIVTAIERGEQNTRWRDFVDIVAISRARRIRYADQRTAIDTVAEYRKIALESFLSLLEIMPDLAQRKWATWRRKQRLETTTPELFRDLLESCAAFAEPVLDGSADGATWDPTRRAWSTLITEEEVDARHQGHC